MKRCVGAMILLAGAGGCVAGRTDPAMNHFGRATYAKTVPGVVSPDGQPIPVTQDTQRKPVARGSAAPSRPAPYGGTFGGSRGSSGIVTAGYQVPASADPGVQRAVAQLPAKSGSGIQQTSGAGGLLGKHGHGGPSTTTYVPVPTPPRVPNMGIQPVPPMGPPGAVAAVGAITGPFPGPAMSGGRTSVRFASPPGMKVSWYGGAGQKVSVEAPGRYNFPQGGIYRVKLSEIPNRPGMELYPTIEVAPSSLKSVTYLAHSAVPIVFTEEDFEQVSSGNLVVKVIYLPDPQFQDLAVAGLDEIVSSRLEPGVDPIVEAQRRGTVLLIVRIGNIDLEAPNTPGMDAPPGGMGGLPPGAMPPGAMPPGGPVNPLPNQPKALPQVPAMDKPLLPPPGGPVKK